jgi:hypothetical protein
VVLVGAPGAGKTQIAAELARRELGQGGEVLWLNARSEHAMAGDLNVLGELLRVSRLDLPRYADGALAWLNGVTVRRVPDSARPFPGSPSGMLVVADGATDLATLRRWLPSNERLRIVVTTDDPVVAARPGTTAVRVGELAPDEALTLLAAGHDPTGGQAVLDEVGGLPLFVALAAAAMRVGRLGFAEYLDRLRARTAETGDVETAVVRLAVTALVPDATSIAGLLARYLALLSPAGAVHGLITGIDLTRYDLRPENQLIEERDRALSAFAEHGLVTTNVHGSSVMMHPVVAAAIREMYEPSVLAVAVDLGNKAFDTILAGDHQRWLWEHVIDNVDALLAAEVDSALPADEYGYVSTRLTAAVMSHRARAVAYLLADGDLVRASAQLRLLAGRCDALLAVEFGEDGE